MVRPKRGEDVVPLALAVVVSLAAAPIVRTVTVELNNTLGRVWPFSMTRCHSLATPGCVGQILRSARTLQGPPTKTGPF